MSENVMFFAAAYILAVGLLFVYAIFLHRKLNGLQERIEEEESEQT